MELTRDVLSPVDAEIYVRQLRRFAVSEVGSPEWKEQREAVERLNMCAHSNAVQKKDDFVKTFLIEHNHLGSLVHELLVMETWRRQVLPIVHDSIAKNPTACYMYCYYEGVLINLIECIGFYEEVVVALEDDALELVDYCWRQVYPLFGNGDAVNVVEPALTAEELQQESLPQHLDRQLRRQSITRTMACLSILWFVIDQLDVLPLSVTNAVLIKNDLPVGLSEVLMMQPWVRRSRTVTQKYCSAGEFAVVSGDEVMRVCIPEAHTWFSLHRLLCNRDCRAKYTYTKHKKDVILRIRRFLNDTLVDQIPALQNVQRALEELSFIEPPAGTEEKFKSALVIEQVPHMMAEINSGKKDWNAQAHRLQSMLDDPRERAQDAMRMARIFDEMIDNSSAGSSSPA